MIVYFTYDTEQVKKVSIANNKASNV